jgi:hypothetical protein
LDDGTGTRSPDWTGAGTGPTDWRVREPNIDAEARFLAFLARFQDHTGLFAPWYRSNSEAIAHNEKVARLSLAAKRAIARKHPRPRLGL